MSKSRCVNFFNRSTSNVTDDQPSTPESIDDYISTRSDSPEVGETYLIFRRMSPEVGLDIVTQERGGILGSFLIRESSVAGMLTIDYLDNRSIGKHMRLQYQLNPNGQYHWAEVYGMDVGHSIYMFMQGEARPINADNFNSPAVKTSLFNLLSDLGFDQQKMIYANASSAAEDYLDYTSVDYDFYNENKAQTLVPLMGR